MGGRQGVKKGGLSFLQFAEQCAVRGDLLAGANLMMQAREGALSGDVYGVWGCGVSYTHRPWGAQGSHRLSGRKAVTGLLRLTAGRPGPVSQVWLVSTPEASPWLIACFILLRVLPHESKALGSALAPLLHLHLLGQSPGHVCECHHECWSHSLQPHLSPSSRLLRWPALHLCFTSNTSPSLTHPQPALISALPCPTPHAPCSKLHPPYPGQNSFFSCVCVHTPHLTHQQVLFAPHSNKYTPNVPSLITCGTLALIQVLA